MRTRHLAVAVACLAAACTQAAPLRAQNAPAGGAQETAARREMAYSFLVHGRLDVYPMRQAFKAAAPAGRAKMMKDLVEWARAYSDSPDFKARYEQERAGSRPTPPKGKSADAELARQKAEQQKSIDEMKKNLAQLPPELRKQMETTIKEIEAQTAKQNADPQMAAMMRQGAEMQIADEQKQYQEALARYNERYPADPKVLIAGRLRNFLDVSKDVDFAAALVPGPNGKQRFANAAYEARSAEWKQYFRAGKEPIAAAREAAQSWLAALPNPGR